MKWNSSFMIGDRLIGAWAPTYFIADIGANHDGSLGRAKELIKLAKGAGADCAKFQHFKAEKIVSAVGFDGFKTAHQRGWDKAVFEVYQDYSINPDWNEELAATCRAEGIDFMTTPYDIEAAERINYLVKAFKIGSGDITYRNLIYAIAKLQKPVFLATGASTWDEVQEAVRMVLSAAGNPNLCLMQCNTDYTGNEQFKGVNLNVLRSYAVAWPELPLGLSDHTPGHITVLGAVTMGARVIEKHFTDDNSRSGPDHSFALSPESWTLMVWDTRLLERSMGDGIKKVEENEQESRIVQRRALRARYPLLKGRRVGPDDFVALRPCPDAAMTPSDIWTSGELLTDLAEGQELYRDELG